MSEESEAGQRASGYLAYMLRLRRAWRDGLPVWLASIESPHTGERQVFAGLEELFAFLAHETGSDLIAAPVLDTGSARASGREENDQEMN